VPRYAPMGYIPEPRYRRAGEDQEEVEDFRQTFDMKQFSTLYKKRLGVTDFLKRSLGSAMAEAESRRNMYGQAVGSLLNFQNRAPRMGRRMHDVAGQGGYEGSSFDPLPEGFEEGSEALTRHATQRQEEAPFDVGSLIDVVGKRGRITDRAFRMRK